MKKKIILAPGYGLRIHALRRKRKLTQARLAQLLKCDQTTISSYELEKVQPTKKTLEKIALHLSVSAKWLITGQAIDEETGMVGEVNFGLDGFPQNVYDKNAKGEIIVRNGRKGITIPIYDFDKLKKLMER